MSSTSRRQFLIATAGAGAAVASVPAAGSQDADATRHIVLIGDSIFANAPYVPGKPEVIQQLKSELGSRGKATLLARDGATTANLPNQLDRLPKDATHLVVSIGGNDALQRSEILSKAVKNSSEVFTELAAFHEQFRTAYKLMLGRVLEVARPTAVCTIYDSNFDQPKKKLADVALSVFNDCIIRSATEAGVPVIDLRRIFTERRDYANSIEPSEIGGAKMVKVIIRVMQEHEFAKGRTTLYC